MHKHYKTIGITGLVYSILIFTGGCIGFALKSSLPSLLAGGIFGLALLYCSVKTLTARRWSVIANIMLTLTLNIFFGYRLLTTHVFMPSGIMTIISILTLIILLKHATKLSSHQQSSNTQ